MPSRRTLLGGLMSAGVASSVAKAQVAGGDTPLGETILDPNLPIIDAHHHLLGLPGEANAYLVPQLMADLSSGHRIVATVAVEGSTGHFLKDGPEAMRPVGEIEFIEAATRRQPRIGAGMVGWADLRLGDQVTPMLEAQAAAAHGRFCGVRQSAAWDAYPVMGIPLPSDRNHLYDDPKFREGFARLGQMGFTFDAWVFHTQLPMVAQLAAAFPNTTIVLDHIGTPIGVGPYADKIDEVFSEWRRGLQQVAANHNVVCKFGGLAMTFTAAFPPPGQRSAEALAQRWSPWLGAVVDAFGPRRIMFESNFPPDRAGTTYAALWNAYKLMTRSFGSQERAALFGRNAADTYRLSPNLLNQPRIT